MSTQKCALTLTLPDSSKVRIAYLDHPADLSQNEFRGVVVLLHGFPQTSFQFRDVIPALAAKGYQCIAPDYRGAGGSSRSLGADINADFRKVTMAGDIVALLDKLDITEPVILVGHDIGGMVAFALATRYPDRVRALCWGECPLPGTEVYDREMADPQRVREQFHFIFHCAPDGLAEALVANRERTYIEHFLHKNAYNLNAFPPEVVDEYARAYRQPGAMACAFGLYRAFTDDAKENKAWIAEQGKCLIPTMIINGADSRHGSEVVEMAEEFTEEIVEVVAVQHAGHYVAEENPKGFITALVRFIEHFDEPSFLV